MHIPNGCHNQTTSLTLQVCTYVGVAGYCNHTEVFHSKRKPNFWTVHNTVLWPMVCLIIRNNRASLQAKGTFWYLSTAVLLYSPPLYMCLFACLVVACLRLHRQTAYRLALYQILSTLFYSFTEILALLLINFNKENGYYIHACTAMPFLVMYSLWVQQLITFFWWHSTFLFTWYLLKTCRI